MPAPAIDSRLERKAAGREAKLCYVGHATMVNRQVLAVAAPSRSAPALPSAALGRLFKAKAKKAGSRISFGEDKAYENADHVADLRALNVTPHVVRNDSFIATGKRRQSAIDGRTARHKGDGLSQSSRAMIDASSIGANGSARCAVKTSGRNRGHCRFHAQSDRYNLIRIPKLLTASRKARQPVDRRTS